MTMKTMLDDAAAHATADARLDLALVLRRAVQEAAVRRRRTRMRGAASSLAAAAAVILVMVVLLPIGSLVRGEGMPAGEPAPVPRQTGVPASWYYAPEWTPPVTRQPMTAAVMVLSAPLETGSLRNRWSGRGPVLVSADAKTYAALPDWGADDGGVTLSSDGRRVAWWTANVQATAGAPPKPMVVHMLTLATGEQHDAILPRGTPRSMAWAGGDVVLSGVEVLGRPELDQVKRTLRAWRIDGDTGRSAQLCTCMPSLLGTAKDGLVQSVTWRDSFDHILAPMPRFPIVGQPDLGPGETAVMPADFTAPALTVRPDGRASADIVQVADGSWWVALRGIDADGGQSMHPLAALGEPITSARLLGWTRAGLVIQVDSSDGLAKHRSVRIVDPDNGGSELVSRPHETATVVPVGIATGLVTSAEPIPATPPAFDGRDRTHLTFFVAHAWTRYAGLVIAAGVVIAVLIGGLGTRWVRKRRRPVRP